jgi:hypothetical protein
VSAKKKPAPKRPPTLTEVSTLAGELDRVLRSIAQTVDETHDLFERAIQAATSDRSRADDLLADPELVGTSTILPDAGPVERIVTSLNDAVSNLNELHTLCLRLIDERETLGNALQEISWRLAAAGVPRAIGSAKKGKPS